MSNKKQVERQQREMRKVTTKEEVIELINKHAKYERTHVENAIGLLRTALQTEIVGSLALAELLIAKGLITKEEYENKMQEVASEMDKMLQLEKGE